MIVYWLATTLVAASGSDTCAALSKAKNLAVVEVVAATPDCSGVGHLRVVLEVRGPAHGRAMKTIVTSEPLIGLDRTSKGDVFVASLEHRPGPKKNVYCVPMPAHDGRVREKIPVANVAEGTATLQRILAGGPCRKPVRVFFVGNSYTYVNDLPGHLERLSTPKGGTPRIQARAFTIPGGTLQQHLELGVAMSRIRNHGFDYVVLQEHSRGFVDHPAKTEASIRALAKQVREAGSKPLVFMTWPRRSEPGFDKKMFDGYAAFAKRNKDIPVVPVGRRWWAQKQRDGFYTPDGSHPSATGTLVAACVFHEHLLGEAASGAIRIREDHYGQASTYYDATAAQQALCKAVGR